VKERAPADQQMPCKKGIIRQLAKYRGFGFIKVNGFQDLFFHRDDAQDAAFDLLGEGQSVEFDVPSFLRRDALLRQRPHPLGKSP